MTKAELTKEEVLEKFKDVELKFSRYYKYTFTFEGKCGDYTISMGIGGNAGDIYRYEVTADATETIGNGCYIHLIVLHKDQVESVFEEWDY